MHRRQPSTGTKASNAEHKAVETNAAHAEPAGTSPSPTSTTRNTEPDPPWWHFIGFTEPPTVAQLVAINHPKPHWGIDMIKLTEEEITDFQNFREYQHICERHAVTLYEAIKHLNESIRAALDEESPTPIRLRDLDTKPMHDAMGAIFLDLTNAGLIDKT